MYSYAILNLGTEPNITLISKKIRYNLFHEEVLHYDLHRNNLALLRVVLTQAV